MNHHCRERRGLNQRNKRLHTKRTTLHFVVGNEQRFPLLLGTNNPLRIFMVLSETKSALVIKISQRYCLLTVWNSDRFSICFFGRLDFFFRATLLKFRATWLRFQATWLRARWLSGDLTSYPKPTGRNYAVSYRRKIL